jgi:hypothetical protein
MANADPHFLEHDGRVRFLQRRHDASRRDKAESGVHCCEREAVTARLHGRDRFIAYGDIIAVVLAGRNQTDAVGPATHLEILRPPARQRRALTRRATKQLRRDSHE